MFNTKKILLTLFKIIFRTKLFLKQESVSLYIIEKKEKPLKTGNYGQIALIYIFFGKLLK